MEVLIRDSAETGCVLGAKIIASVVREKPNAVLGLATGRTPLRLYQELIRFPAIEGRTWNHPAMSDGILLIRNIEEMAAFDLRKSAK